MPVDAIDKSVQELRAFAGDRPQQSQPLGSIGGGSVSFPLRDDINLSPRTHFQSVDSRLRQQRHHRLFLPGKIHLENLLALGGEHPSVMAGKRHLVCVDFQRSRSRTRRGVDGQRVEATIETKHELISHSGDGVAVVIGTLAGNTIGRQEASVHRIAVQNARARTIPIRPISIDDNAKTESRFVPVEANKRRPLFAGVTQPTYALDHFRAQRHCRQTARQRGHNPLDLFLHGATSRVASPHRFGESMISPGTSLTSPVAWFAQ